MLKNSGMSIDHLRHKITLSQPIKTENSALTLKVHTTILSLVAYNQYFRDYSVPKYPTIFDHPVFLHKLRILHLIVLKIS